MECGWMKKHTKEIKRMEEEEKNMMSNVKKEKNRNSE